MYKQHTFDNSLMVLDSDALNQVSGGNIGPEGDLSNFPRWVWPYIRPGASLVNSMRLL